MKTDGVEDRQCAMDGNKKGWQGKIQRQRVKEEQKKQKPKKASKPTKESKINEKLEEFLTKQKKHVERSNTLRAQKRQKERKGEEKTDNDGKSKAKVQQLDRLRRL